MGSTYIWGTGYIASYVMQHFNEKIEEINIVGFIDNDINKVGTQFFNKEIYAPNVLEKDRNATVIILCNAYEQIQSQIEKDYPWINGRIENTSLFVKFRILARYKNSNDSEIEEVLQYLEKHKLQVFNYEFAANYINREYEILFDSSKQLFYTILEGKRMFLARHLNTKQKALQYVRQIMMEQDMESPHCYLPNKDIIENNAIVVDAGVAEGNFALSVIDKVKKIYLYEPDEAWVEALRYTFEPYKDKVVLYNKYLSDYEADDTTTIDASVREKIDFIKMDIEGQEYFALKGAKETLHNAKKVTCAVCTYHNVFDSMAIEQILRKWSFDTEYSKGYMWFPYDEEGIFGIPTLRKGLVRGTKR